MACKIPPTSGKEGRKEGISARALHGLLSSLLQDLEHGIIVPIHESKDPIFSHFVTVVPIYGTNVCCEQCGLGFW